jgi:hypothetical protein
VEVVDPEQVGVEVAVATLENLVQNPALGGLGAGMPMRKARVGATSTARIPETGLRLRIPGPAATKVPCMLRLWAMSTDSGR